VKTPKVLNSDYIEKLAVSNQWSPSYECCRCDVFHSLWVLH